MSNTIPDPHLTREEAEHLSERCTESTNAPKVNGYSCEICRAIDAKLRNSLSAPLVEDGGLEEAVEEILAKRFYENWYSAMRVDVPVWEEATAGAQEPHREEAEEIIAAIQSFLGQGDETQYRVVVRQSGEVMPLGIEPLGCCASRLTAILAAAPGTEIEDAWGERRSVTYGRWERCPVQQHKEEEKV